MLDIFLCPFSLRQRRPIVGDSSYPPEIKTRWGKFRRLDKAGDLRYPQGGYWNDGLIEFDRSVGFMDWRFFTLKDKYQVYALEVAEPVMISISLADNTILLRGPLLYVVDYRFAIGDEEGQNAIIKASLSLSRQMGFAGVYIRSSLPVFSQQLKRNAFGEKQGGADIVARFKPATQREYAVFHTSADSDMDFK